MLAERAGVQPSTILRLEHGTPPRPATLGKLAAALGCTVDALLTADELATVGTRPRAPRRDGGPAREPAPVCARCGQPCPAEDRWHAGGADRADGAPLWHRQCRKAQTPRPELAPCCYPGGACGH